MPSVETGKYFPQTVANSQEMREQRDTLLGGGTWIPYGGYMDHVVPETTVYFYREKDAHLHALQSKESDRVIFAKHSIATAQAHESSRMQEMLLSSEGWQQLIERTILLRHADTVNTELQILAGAQDDSKLTQNGINEAERARGIVSLYQFGLILSSPQQRGLQTAKIMSGKEQSIDIQTIENLKELDFGDWEKQRYDDVKDTDLWQNWIHKPISEKDLPKNGEPFIDFLKRVNLATHYMHTAMQLLDRNQQIVVVTHRTVLSAIKFLSLLAKNGVITLADEKELIKFERLCFYEDEEQTKQDNIPHAVPLKIGAPAKLIALAA